MAAATRRAEASYFVQNLQRRLQTVAVALELRAAAPLAQRRARSVLLDDGVPGTVMCAYLGQQCAGDPAR